MIYNILLHSPRVHFTQEGNRECFCKCILCVTVQSTLLLIQWVSGATLCLEISIGGGLPKTSVSLFFLIGLTAHLFSNMHQYMRIYTEIIGSFNHLSWVWWPCLLKKDTQREVWINDEGKYQKKTIYKCCHCSRC